MNIKEQLEKLTCKNLEDNKNLLYVYKEKLKKHIHDKHKGYFKNEEKPRELVYQTLFSKMKNNLTKDEKEKYISAQCVSIICQIDKFAVDNSIFNINYKNFILEDDLTLITQELIYDIRRFCLLFDIELEDKTIRDVRIPSIDFYKLARFSFFTKKPRLVTNRNMSLAIAVVNIRNAIDAKLLEMIGFDISFNSKGHKSSLKVTDLMKFFSKKENEYFFPNIPVSFSLLKIIYDWSSEYIHSMEPHFCWQVLQAIDILEPLFSIKDRNNDYLDINGISYLSRDIDINDLKSRLENEMKLKIVLHNDFYIES